VVRAGLSRPRRLILLALAWLSAACASAGEARLLLPERFPPGAGIDGSVEVSDAGSPVAELAFPELDGVRWERLPGGMTEQITINRSTRSTQRIPIRVRVERAGDLTLPPLRMTLLDGRVLETAPRPVTVRAGETRLVGEAVCWAEFSPRSTFTGVPVELVYTCAFVDPSLQIERFGIAPPPQAAIGGSREERGEIYAADGRRWQTLVKRWTLSFAEPGQVAVRGRQEYLPCEPFGNQYIPIGPRRRVAVPEARLIIRPMPSDGRPADWNGLVGPVIVSASLDRPRIALGEGTRLRVRVAAAQPSGLVRPRLPPLRGMQAVPRDAEGSIGAGERVFAWDLEPLVAGSLRIPPIAVPYFDVADERFRSATSAPLTLEVGGGAATEVTIAGGGGGGPEPDHELGSQAPAPPALPAPRRGDGAGAWSAATLARFGAASLAVVALAALAARWRPRPGRIHRGRQLAAALAAEELETAARIASALRVDVPDADLPALDAFDGELAAVRFGGAAPHRLAALAAPLMERP
jgi:hypothetical protein